MKTTILTLIYLFLDPLCTNKNTLINHKLTIITPYELSLTDTLSNLNGQLINDTLYITFKNN